MYHQAGKLLIVAGVMLIIAGIILLFSIRWPVIGHLPGDIRIVKKNFTIFIPVTTMILLSLIVSLLLYLFRKL